MLLQKTFINVKAISVLPSQQFNIDKLLLLSRHAELFIIKILYEFESNK